LQFAVIVKTIDDTGTQQIYLFDLYHKKEQVPGVNGVSIIQQIEKPVTDEDRLVWRVDNRVATLSDIEQGLRVSIVKGWTKPDDEVVGKVREFLAIAYNTPKITLTEAASKVGLDLAVVSELAKTGLDFRFIQQPSDLNKPNINETRRLQKKSASKTNLMVIIDNL
jgi:hypothetical protein